ncbi:MAG TPA: HAMP domain-containing sensor histidine kinase [Solirubrobacteraceae bacterium]|nr:HAMP domain-containing sensor histidine kinase [Solirubrobacteraceae bacterium]
MAPDTSSEPERPRLSTRISRPLDRLPIRARLALASALLTFVILCVFAVAIGSLTVQRIREDFNHQVTSDARQVASRLTITGTPRGLIPNPPLAYFAGLGEHSVLRIFTLDGTLLRQEPEHGPSLGPLMPDAAVNHGGYRVVTEHIPVYNERGLLEGFVELQYGRSVSEIASTIGRVELFLILGVLGGTALALLAGIAIARRAMAPIARLTNTAEEIARTRDPSREVPDTGADDEVGELARTLQSMLSELDAARGESEAMLALQRRFVADASHELRTPLTSVLANLELLVDSLTGEQAESARAALRSTQRMRRLVADLLVLARNEGSKLSTPRPCSLDAIAVDAVAELEPVAGAHEISVDAQAVRVRGAEDDLHRMAVNLVANSIEHTPDGTTIHVTVRPAPGGMAELLVADDGPGVPADVAPHLFNRFVSGEGDRGGSTGLGLAIVRAVAQSHGGSVELLRDGPGARFRVLLPALSDLDDDGQHHRPAAQPVVDQLR